MTKEKQKILWISIILYFVFAGIISVLVVQYIWNNPLRITSGELKRAQEEYSFPDILLTADDEIVQYFRPTDNGMSEIYVRLAFDHQALLEECSATISICLMDENDNVLKIDEISSENINNWEYIIFSLKDVEALKKDKTYKLVLKQVEGPYNDSGNTYQMSYVPFIYYPGLDDVSLDENIKCEYNGVEQEYEWENYYVYERFNLKACCKFIGLTILILVFFVVAFWVLGRIKFPASIWIMALLSPIIQYILVEMITGNLFLIQKDYHVMNIVIFYVVLLIVFAIVNSMKAALMTTYSLFSVMALVYYYVDKLRGRPFLIQDIKNVKTAYTVMGAYSFEIEPKVGLFLLIAVGLVCLGIWLPDIKIKRFKLICKMGAISVCVVFALLFSDKNFMQTTYPVSLNFWDLESSYGQHGYLLTLLDEIQYLKQSEPEGYVLENVEEIAEKYVKSYENNNTEELIQPENLIVIMNESWADFRYISDFEDSETITPYIDSLDENIVKGYLHVPVFGAGTDNTEYEFLTGNSVRFLDGLSTAYQFYTEEAEWGLATTLNEQGYETVALHPNTATNWNRNSVYSHMQFDEFYALDNWPGELGYLRWCASDLSSYEAIMKLYDNKAEEEKLFTFLVTMQNHGGYDWEEYLPTVDLNYDEEYPQTEQYLSLLQETDKAFESLVKFFDEKDEPTMIVMFGDHLPNVEEGFYEILFGKAEADMSSLDKQKKYATPFIIWANYEMETETGIEMSSNYFGSYVLQVAGVELTDYNKCLLEFKKELPIIGNGVVCDDTGAWCSWGEMQPTQANVWYDYKILQYNNVFEQDNCVNSIFSLTN